MATLFISQILPHHGFPKSIESDRDPRMTSNFSKGLFDHLGSKLNFSLAYHPQTDGQIEITNLTILDLLKAYVMEVDQRNQWEKHLPLLEYAYNNTTQFYKQGTLQSYWGKTQAPINIQVFGADEYTRDLKESFDKIKEIIYIA